MQEAQIVTVARKLLGNMGIACSNLVEGEVHCIGLGNGKYTTVTVTGPESEEATDELVDRAVAIVAQVEADFGAIH